jgi:hypothetical protein
MTKVLFSLTSFTALLTLTCLFGPCAKAMYEEENNSFDINRSPRQSFERVWSLSGQEKNKFLADFVGAHGDIVLSFCKENEAYRRFFVENKESVLKGTEGYMMRHKEAAFWTAWIEYIESNPTHEQWERAEYVNRQESFTYNNQSEMKEILTARANSYKNRQRKIQ